MDIAVSRPSWPDYHRATEADRSSRRQASSLQALIILGWQASYERQRTELRKAGLERFCVVEQFADCEAP